MATLFRHGDPRFPFLWESGPQPAARWHAADDARCTYLADSPDGAWAEFLRHEAITAVEDLAGISRRIWAVEIPDEVLADAAHPVLPDEVTRGDLSSYPACQAEALRLRNSGAAVMITAGAALVPGGARGQVVGGGLREAPERDGVTIVLFGGGWPEVRGWAAVDAGAPTARVLTLTRQL